MSDEPAPFQILDRRSFHHFPGLSEADPVPDQNTIREFREKLTRAEWFGERCAAFNARLTPQGFLTRKGQIIDASLVEGPRQRNRREENAALKRGAGPASWETEAKRLAPKDLDARWTKKNHQPHDGYKDHVLADWESQLIVRAEVTVASAQDRQALDPLTRAGDPPTWADSAHGGAPCQEIFAAKGIVAHGGEKGVRGQALTRGQKRSNRAKSRQRARGEPVFGFKTGSMRARFQRAIGFARNRAGIIRTNRVYHLARTEPIIRLKRLGRKPPQLV